jgi:hypothetical protein
MAELKTNLNNSGIEEEEEQEEEGGGAREIAYGDSRVEWRAPSSRKLSDP